MEAAMNMLWPGSLYLLGLIPLLIAVYILALRRRRKFVVRYSSLSLVRQALPPRSNLRRHIPFVLFLLGLASLIMALTRPVTYTRVPAGNSTVILAMDVSRSMRQRDIQPSRLEAAKEAALTFIEHQPPSTQIGVVAFSGYAELILPPTTDSERLRAAVQSLTLGRRTAIGAGIIESVDAIAEVFDGMTPVTGGSGITDGSGSTDGGGATDLLPQAAPEGGVFAPAIIVLLTDGVSTTGPLPLDAAQQAVERGIRVYTIGFGTENGEAGFGVRRQPNDDPSGGGSDPNGQLFPDPQQGGQQGGWFRRGIDEDTLRNIASITGARYYAADSASELEEVFSNLPTNLVTRPETTEISVLFTAIAALMAAAAMLLALRWQPLP